MGQWLVGQAGWATGLGRAVSAVDYQVRDEGAPSP